MENEIFFDKPLFKKIFTIAVPILMTICNSMTGKWVTDEGKFNTIKWVDIIIVGIYLLMQIRYAINENKKQKIEQQLNEQINNLDNKIVELTKHNTELSDIISVFDKTNIAGMTIVKDAAESIYEIAKRIEQKSYNNMFDNWNYKKVAVGICDKLYEIITSYTSNTDFSVNIWLYQQQKKGKRTIDGIKMIAHSGSNANSPRRYGQQIPLSNKSFFAVKIFTSDEIKAVILTSPDEINAQFSYEHPLEKPTYNQYIAIPIYCSGNKIISLLEICAYNNSKLANSKLEIQRILERYMYIFVNYALLSNKIQRALSQAILQLKEKEGDA